MKILFALALTSIIVQVYALDCGDGQIRFVTQASILKSSHCVYRCFSQNRGVNLGGWLLLEPWITPTIFEEVNVGDIKNMVVDEYTYAQYVDKEFAKERLER